MCYSKQNDYFASFSLDLLFTMIYIYIHTHLVQVIRKFNQATQLYTFSDGSEVNMKVNILKSGETTTDSEGAVLEKTVSSASEASAPVASSSADTTGTTTTANNTNNNNNNGNNAFNNARANSASMDAFTRDTRWCVTVVATKRSESSSTAGDETIEEQVEHEVPLTSTIAQVLAGLKQCSGVQDTHLKLRISKVPTFLEKKAIIPLCSGVTSLLEEFSSQGGLSLLAQHMTILYPDTSNQSAPQHSSQLNKTSSGPNTPLSNSIINAANISNNSSLISGSSGPSMQQQSGSSPSVPALSSVAPHTLGAFTLFLRLPAYAEMLLLEPTKAKALLKMALGVQDTGRDSLRPDTIANMVYTRFNQVLAKYSVSTAQGKKCFSIVYILKT